MDQNLGAGGDQVSHSHSVYHKSSNSAAKVVLVSPLYPFDTMVINYIKAGWVNLEVVRH